MTKKERELVYSKFNGHCAYCGCHLEYKDMQVDHIVSRCYHNGEDTISNYYPSCRQCNFYKSTYSIEQFRHNLESVIWNKLKDSFNYRLLVKYGQIVEQKTPIKFYFEVCEGETE